MNRLIRQRDCCARELIAYAAREYRRGIVAGVSAIKINCQIHISIIRIKITNSKGSALQQHHQIIEQNIFKL